MEATDILLLDENGDFLTDDQAIFVERIVTDGDTRGSLKFVSKQNKIIGSEYDGQAEHIPDIDHFIKYISNGFY